MYCDAFIFVLRSRMLSFEERRTALPPLLDPTSTLLLLLLFLLLHLPLPAVHCEATSRPEESLLVPGSGGLSAGGLRSILEDSVSPAFGATIIIIITVVMSGSAYLCFLRYVCAGCCRPLQVAPAAHDDDDPEKVEEQV